MKQSGHWRRSKNHFRRSLIQEPWRLERILTPYRFQIEQDAERYAEYVAKNVYLDVFKIDITAASILP